MTFVKRSDFGAGGGAGVANVQDKLGALGLTSRPREKSANSSYQLVYTHGHGEEVYA
jgi:hypothetical protein